MPMRVAQECVLEVVWSGVICSTSEGSRKLKEVLMLPLSIIPGWIIDFWQMLTQCYDYIIVGPEA
jgi:hypothetical protein